MESVELKVTFRADPGTARKIQERIPSARVKDGNCQIVMRGDSPSEVASAVRQLLEKVRDILEPAKDFKQPERSRSQN